MPVAAEFEVNKQDLAAMKRAMRAMQDELKWSGKKAAIKYAKFVLTSMENSTPIAPTKREVIDNPAYAQYKGKRKKKGEKRPSKFLILAYQPDGKVKELPTNYKQPGKDKRIKIARRGLARASWQWSKRRFGRAKAPKSEKPAIKRLASKVVRTDVKGPWDNYYIRVINNLRYALGIATISPSQAMNEGERKAESFIKQQLEKAAAKAAKA